MSHIAVDLKVLETHAPAVARATEQPVTHIIGALNLLWHRCWVAKSDSITRVGLAGIFGPSRLDEVIASLVDTGFLEALDGLAWRVKGAEKYLRITDAKSAAGKVRASSAGRSAGRFTSTPPADHQQPTSEPPALTPSTEHRAPSTNKELAPASRSPRDSDLMCADFEEVIGTPYGWNGAKDGTAFAWCLKQAPLEEVRARWRAGLRSNDKWLGVRTVAQLRSKWNDLAKMPLDLTGDWRSRVDHSKDFFAGFE